MKDGTIAIIISIISAFIALTAYARARLIEKDFMMFLWGFKEDILDKMEEEEE
jgi:hypothetical protein